jgi:hypothetical protein
MAEVFGLKTARLRAIIDTRVLKNILGRPFCKKCCRTVITETNECDERVVDCKPFAMNVADRRSLRLLPKIFTDWVGLPPFQGGQPNPIESL